MISWIDSKIAFYILFGVFLFMLLFSIIEYRYNTTSIVEDCRNLGYEGAFHSSRGWFCSAEYNAVTTVSVSYPTNTTYNNQISKFNGKLNLQLEKKE